MKDLINSLSDEYELKKNHADILYVLSSSDATAEDVVSKTQISIGRIYNLLNELLAMNLVEKLPGSPAKYSMRHIEKKVLAFLEQDFQKQVEKQERILTHLEKDNEGSVKIIEKDHEFDLISFFIKGKWFKLSHRDLSLAWFILPIDEEEFWKIRKIIYKRRSPQSKVNKQATILVQRAYWKVYESKPVEHIMTKKALEEYANMLRDEFGPRSVKKWAQEVLDKLQLYPNVSISIADTEFSILNMEISDRESIFKTLTMKKSPAIKLRGSKISKLHTEVFDQMKQKTESIEKYLYEYLK